MTEDTAGPPGWTDERLDELFAGLPAQARAAKDAYAACLKARKAPAAPSDLLGAEFEGCRDSILREGALSGLLTVADRVPGWSPAGVDEAVRLWQAGDHLAVAVVELDPQRVEVGLL